MSIYSLVGRLPSEVVIFLAGPQPGDPDPSNGKGPEWGKAAPVALLIIVLLGLSIVFLVRSMNKHVKKLPKSFEPAVAGGLHGPVEKDSSTGRTSGEASSAATDSATSTAVSTDRNNP